MTQAVTRCIRGCTVNNKHLPDCSCTLSCLDHPDHCGGCQPRPTYEGDLCRGCIQRIHNALTQISTSWEAMLPDPKMSNGGSARTLITRDDGDERTDDVPHLDAIIDARTPILNVLNELARIVVIGRDLHLPPTVDDPHDLVRFLRRHVDWLAGRKGIEAFYDKIRDCAHDVHRVAYPTSSDFVPLGHCPFVVESRFCSGQVRSRIGDDLTASCSACGETGPVQWWKEVLGIAPFDKVVGSPEMTRLLHQRLHLTIAERTVRRWAIDGRISHFTPFGPQPRTPRWWFEPAVVLEEVARMDRPCPTCGRPWSGVGEVCSRCYSAQRSAHPVHAERKTGTPAPVRLHPVRLYPPRVVPDSHDTDRPERCHYSDIPLTTCACGNPLAQHTQPRTLEETA